MMIEKRIGDLGAIVTGKTPPTSDADMFADGFLFVTPTDLDWNTYWCQSTERQVTEKAKNRFGNQFVPVGSTLVTCIGNTIGKIALSNSEVLTNQQINTVVPNQDHDAKFIYYLMLLNREKIRGVGLSGGSATPILNKSQFSQIIVRVPELSVQVAIGRVLSEYDDLIELNRRRIKLLEEAARLIYREWFVRLRFPGHEHAEIVNGIPEGWVKKSVYEIAEVLSGGTPKTDNPAYWDGDIPFFTPKDAGTGILVNQTEKMITDAGLRNCNSKLYPQRTVFITARGTVGKVRMPLVPMAMNQTNYALRSKEGVSQEFLYFAVENSVSAFKSQASGSVFDAIVVETFKKIQVLLPSRVLLEEFVTVASPLLDQVGILMKQSELLKSARDLLLPRLMSGEIEV